MDWSNFLSAVFGAFVGGFFSAYAADKAHNHNVALQDYQRDKQLDGVLLAILQELTLANKIYETQTGALLEKLEAGKGFHEKYFRARGEYFQAYKSNVALVGQIENEELSKSIFTAQTLITALIEELHINNEYLERRDRAQAECATTQTSAAYNLVNHWTKHLIEHGEKLKRIHNLCTAEGRRARELIADFRLNHPPRKPNAINFLAKIFSDE